MFRHIDFLSDPLYYSCHNSEHFVYFTDHWIAMNVKLIIVQLLSTREKLDSLEKTQRSIELCENYLQVYDKVSQGYTKWRGHIRELQSSATLKQYEILNEKVHFWILFILLDILKRQQ